MPIKIGQKPESDIRNPLGLLTDCHRRIELFLHLLKAVSEDRQGKQLQEESRQHLDLALRYFREAAPKHTLHEEESLFPRLPAHLSSTTLAVLDKLQIDHTDADAKHQQIDALGGKWLVEGSLSQAEIQMLIWLLNNLAK